MLIGPAFVVALFGAIESLLSAVAVDKMRSGPRTNLNKELMGQFADGMLLRIAAIVSVVLVVALNLVLLWLTSSLWFLTTTGVRF